MQGRMPIGCNLAVLSRIIAALFLLVISTPGWPRTSDICVAAAENAAQDTGVPAEVLIAISLTETGRAAEGVTRPWPWTINIAGQGYWLDNKNQVLRYARASLADEVDSFDLGCFQINYRWHGENFSSLEQMLEPDVGAAYAARFLKTIYAETGDWSAAAGTYHSRTPVFANRYRTVFDQHYAAVKEGTGGDTVPIQQPNAFPLLQSGEGRARLGSLVPVFDGG